MASKRIGWALAALTLLGGCGSAAKRQATQDSLAQVELQARRDSLQTVKAARDSVARISYAACTDSVRKALMKTPAGRATLRVMVPDGQPRPENLAACGTMPGDPVAKSTTSPVATAPAASLTPQQQRVARADSLRMARERARADSLGRVAERKRTDSLTRVAADAARTDSTARARETEVLRESFSYSGSSRDPFVSVVSQGNAGPDIGDMILVAILADSRSARSSVAVLREETGTRRWRVKVGDHVGTATVTLITQRNVTFSVQDFGFERQETLSLRNKPEVIP